MVGNSSSGLIEAASFCLPVVNIGTRQTGRVRGRNVCDCGYTAGEIRAAIDRAASADFRREVRGMTNPYGDGRAGPRIAARLAEVPIDSALLAKRFIDRSVDDDR
jgi:UDP-N-acetylglucosamine 2-epimerase